MTIWKAKGLQFPVVCLPMLWRPARNASDVVYTDPESGRRTMDLAKGKDWPDATAAEERKQLARREEASEELRLLYVALTRAQHHTSVWWANSSGEFDTGDQSVPVLAGLPGRSDRPVGVRSRVDAPSPLKTTSPSYSTHWPSGRAGPSPSPPSSTRPNRRQPGSTPWLHRNRSNCRSAASPWPSTGPCTAGRSRPSPRARKPVPAATIPTTRPERTAAPTTRTTRPSRACRTMTVLPPPAPPPVDAGGPLARLRAGTEFGTFVHAVLERVDFAAADLDGAIADAVRTELDHQWRRPVAPGAGGWPMGRICWPPGSAPRSRRRSGRCSGRPDWPISDVATAWTSWHSTCGSARRAGTRPSRTSDRWSLPRSRAGIPLRPLGNGAGRRGDRRPARRVPDRIDRPGGPASATDGGASRFVVADYKTNRLTPWGADPGPHDYDIGHMVDAMSEHHYPLQALLYAVALQRYLRSRTRPGGPTGQVVGADLPVRPGHDRAGRSPMTASTRTGCSPGSSTPD